MTNVVIKDERTYRVIAGNAVSVLNTLPANIYELCFSERNGFSLDEIDNGFNTAKKLYGDVEKITNRVLNSFGKTEGNLGVLLSGPKGLGKSLTTKTICQEALKKGMPVILVKENFGNIVSYLETIYQPCVIVLDEFEKIYPDMGKTDKDDIEGQDSLLNLFDSTLAAKKLFLLTCNDVHNISEYLLNRPGRIHYHFKSNRLSISEIADYCGDNLLPELESMIPDICAMGARIPDFSYDMLRAVLFELNTYKCPLKEIQETLNINAEISSPFNFKITFKSGKVESGYENIKITSTRFHLCWYGKHDYCRDDAYINPSKAKWIGDDEGSLLLSEDINWPTDDDNKTDDRIEKIIFTPVRKSYLAD